MVNHQPSTAFLELPLELIKLKSDDSVEFNLRCACLFHVETGSLDDLLSSMIIQFFMWKMGL